MENAKKRCIVFEMLRSVPRGCVVTYAALAAASGTHPRAVAAFMRGNTNPVGVPCFRVVMSDGRVGGYSAPGGLARKEELLKIDGISVVEGRVDLGKYLHHFK